MQLRDIIGENGRVFLKSEWGPASSDWPAVSFTKRSVGEFLRREFRPGRDLIVYVGTSSQLTTENPAHRQRLLSAVVIEPMQLLETRECIPPESWEEAQRNFRGRWFWCMPALKIWDFVDFPLASEVMPQSYRTLGFMANRGNVVEVHPDERGALLGLELLWVDFVPARKATAFASTRSFLNLNDLIRSDIGRIAAGILGRVSRSDLPPIFSPGIMRLSPGLMLPLGLALFPGACEGSGDGGVGQGAGV